MPPKGSKKGNKASAAAPPSTAVSSSSNKKKGSEGKKTPPPTIEKRATSPEVSSDMEYSEFETSDTEIDYISDGNDADENLTPEQMDQQIRERKVGTNFVRSTAYGMEATAAHIERTKIKFKRFHLIRSFALSDFITLGNAACGVCSIFFCLNFLENAKYAPYLAGAFVLLPFALIFDILDGSIARCRKRSSPYGMDLDSLADVVSFSVAPAVLGFTLGLRGFYDCAILSFFVCCGISRLARYNVTAPFLSHMGKVKYYQGFPVPTSLFIVVILGVLYRFGYVLDNFLFGSINDILGPGFGSFHPFSLIYFVFGCLMVSEVKIPKP